MEINEFNYHLPSGLIAQSPVSQRDSSRLLVLDRNTERIKHTFFFCLDEYFMAGDVLVVNDTKVMPAKFFGHKETGGKVEVLLLRQLNNPQHPNEKNIWEALIKCSKNPKLGSKIFFGSEFQAQVLHQKEAGLWDIQLNYDGDFDKVLEQYGTTPLPPYIKRGNSSQEPLDRKSYQTIFAKMMGSVAAPTAGLHFTENLINRLQQKGITILTITLHVGLGTFQPVRTKNIENHRMHSEHYEVSSETAQEILSAHKQGRRVIAVGSTSVRVIETLMQKKASLKGATNLFVCPGYDFKITKGMVTNFHLPKSTLLMLVAAFAGKDLIFRAYQEAIANKYRFYSYGDAMLIL